MIPLHALAAGVLCAALALCASANEDLMHRRCSAQWTLVATHQNWSPKPTEKSFHYQVGAHKLQNSRNLLKSILVTVKDDGMRFPSTAAGIGTPSTKYGTFKVPAYATVNVWQLVARTGSEVASLEKTIALRDQRKPYSVVSCQVTYQLPQRITGNTWVQLRHDGTGKYLTTTNRKGWDAGTLSSSKNNKFRFEEIRSGVYRIVADSVRFSGYNYLYSSFAGGIYLDDSDTSNGKQLWTLSTSDLRAGDSIAIENVYYPGAYMIRYEGSTTNVFCEYTSHPDYWTVELA
ncbi:hypothetical protein BOX15_Mlig014210g2 [Macrostomum lignano]|uniref:Uncharacterized protein n=1 Tax=Macrostomum lignano TaxID=282301 RepID=A0A267G8R5_9PLAT|nr:hypothetical protein BOX15_Mlig014210g2 [Macrostomum lignano]